MDRQTDGRREVLCFLYGDYADDSDNDNADDERAPAKIKATIPKRGLQHQKTMHDKTMCATYDWARCTITGCRCVIRLTKGTCRKQTC